MFRRKLFQQPVRFSRFLSSAPSLNFSHPFNFRRRLLTMGIGLLGMSGAVVFNQESSKKNTLKNVLPRRDVKNEKETIAWHELLNGIHDLATQRDLKKKIFISYAWPPEGEERDALQAFLKRLQDDFERAGVQVFLDVRGMQGDRDVTRRNHLETCDFIMPILTPRFLARIQDEKPNNLQFEFNLMIEKAKKNPACLLPISLDIEGNEGEFCEGVFQKNLFFPQKFIYILKYHTKLERYLVGLSDPVGLIPVIYGIQFNDPAYYNLFGAWQKSCLTCLPKSLPQAIEREEMTQLFLPENAHDDVSSSIQIIQGMSGVGKTQLAALYANRRRQDKDFARWMRADKEHLETEWKSLGELLGLDLEGHTIEEQHQAIQIALSQQKNWLIVLDNVENKAALKGLLPEKLLPTQQVLITTRSQNWENDPILALSPFTLNECGAFFEKRLAPEQCIGADELAEELGALPLAMDHATAYLQKTHKTAKAYLKLYREKNKGVALLPRADVKSEADETKYENTILTTYQLSITALASQNPKAAELVTICAYFHPEGIRKSFLKKLANIDEEELDNCICAIREYGLLSKGNTGFNMHRLVQQVIRHQLTVEERKRQMTRVVQCLKALNVDTAGGNVVEQRRKACMPHLEAIITYHDESAIENEHLAQALVQLGNLSLNYYGQPKKSVDLYERALKIQEAHYGRDHYQVASTLTNLGNAYGALGETTRKCDLLERALKIQEARYRREHSQVASTLTNLGEAYGILGGAVRKRDLLERALKIEEELYGRDHYSVAITLTNLGIVYGVLGKTARKRDLLERALAIEEEHYGRDHSALAITLTDLAVAYRTLKQQSHALQTAQRAYRILMDHPQYGADHPRTQQCILYLQSAGKFLLKDLRGEATPDAEAVALNDYSGAFFNQRQRDKVDAALEEKEEANRDRPKTGGSCK